MWVVVRPLVWGLVLSVVGFSAWGQSCDARLAQLQAELARKDAALKDMAARMNRMAQGNIRQVEKALHGTGLKVDTLIRHGAGGGQGGPFIPYDESLPPELERWDRLTRALRVLPLAAPLKDFTVTSGFGKRVDPFNRRRAMHQGLDMKAPLRSPVVATGAGKVVFAGQRGRYGRVVEVDHGLGVHTRYGHLAAIKVRPGQHVAAGQAVGLLGNSGRSTGPHLHYEVLVDGKPRNPVLFLKVGAHVSGSVPLSTDRLRRDSRAAPNSRARPGP